MMEKSTMITSPYGLIDKKHCSNVNRLFYDKNDVIRLTKNFYDVIRLTKNFYFTDIFQEKMQYIKADSIISKRPDAMKAHDACSLFSCVTPARINFMISTSEIPLEKSKMYKGTRAFCACIIKDIHGPPFEEGLHARKLISVKVNPYNNNSVFSKQTLKTNLSYKQLEFIPCPMISRM